jgi:hypothetical protein
LHAGFRRRTITEIIDHGVTVNEALEPFRY